MFYVNKKLMKRLIKRRVFKLGKAHRKLYRFISEYYLELNMAPRIEDMILEMNASSRNEVFRLLYDLAKAGCIRSWDGGRNIRPTLSPEEAEMWCRDDTESLNERICLIDRSVNASYLVFGESIPKFSDFMESYRDSSLYKMIQEQAEPYFNDCVSKVVDTYADDKGETVPF